MITPYVHSFGFEGVIGFRIDASAIQIAVVVTSIALSTGDVAETVCNECEAVVRTVPAAELQHPLDDMELTLDVAGAMSPVRRDAPGTGHFGIDRVRL